MPRLEREKRKILLDVLEQIFLTIDDFAAFLSGQLARNLDDIAGKANLTVSRVAAVRNAESLDWIADLVEELKAYPNIPASLVAELDKIGTSEEIRNPRLFDDCYPNGEPMVNRRDLRDNLRAATEDGPKRILLIKGNRFSGKSHARRHIRHVATRLDIPLADLALREYATSQDVTPYDLGVAIAEAFDHELPARLDSKASRWSLNFLNWLEREIDPKQDRLWIVFDDFEKEKLKIALPDSVYEFIQMLSERVAERMEAVRLFLINYDRDLPVEISFNLLEEKVPAISEDDISDFFLEFYDAYLPPTDLDTAWKDAANRARSISAKIGTDPATRLAAMRAALREECEAMKKGGT